MELLKVTQLTKSYSQKALVDHIDFSVLKNQKIAIVAQNGAGKSTLLKLLTGELDITDGEIAFHKSVNLGFLTQDLRLKGEKTVSQELFDDGNPSVQLIKTYEEALMDQNTSPEAISSLLQQIDESNAREYENKVNTIISKLNIKELLHKTIAQLSGGEAKRVALAKVLVHEPNFLILDEPTNHLDLQMIEWLENYLSQSHITLLMVTHDRYFLERVCDHIWELDRGQLYQYPGNYSYFLQKKSEREQNEVLEMERIRKLLKSELAWIRKAPRARESKSVHREKKFYAIESQYDDRKLTIQSTQTSLSIWSHENKLGDKIIKINNLKKTFGDKKIVHNFSYDFRHKEHIGIIGKNWVGKSTFVRMLMWEEEHDAGSIKVGELVVFWHYVQRELNFPAGKKVIDVVRDIGEFMRLRKWEKISASHLLERFLFPPHQQHQFADTLSGGEKRRLHLLMVLMKNPNFLVLDEPTNDLDLITLAVLENFLLEYPSCLLIISHDRFFMDRVVDRLFVFEWDGHIEDFRWNYSEYQEKKKSQEKLKKDKSIALESTKEETQTATGTKQKLSYMEKRELDQFEKDLEKLEDRKHYINTLFQQSDIPYDDIKKLSQELWELTRHIEIKESRWMELSERNG